MPSKELPNERCDECPHHKSVHINGKCIPGCKCDKNWDEWD